MKIWRISNYNDLSGEGGRRAAGRWHEKGRPVVYCADHPALALLETMVHLEVDADDLPDGYRLLEIDVPDTLNVLRITQSELSKLSTGWSSNARITRGHLIPWFNDMTTALVAVPSVVTPYSTNYLINPLHPEASKIRIVSSERYPYDQRVFGSIIKSSKI